MGIEFQWFSAGKFLKCILESGCINRKKIEYGKHKSEVFNIGCLFFVTVPFFKTVLEFRIFGLEYEKCLYVKYFNALKAQNLVSPIMLGLLVYFFGVSF